MLTPRVSDDKAPFEECYTTRDGEFFIPAGVGVDVDTTPFRARPHVGGYFSVPPRTVWICCFLLISRIPCLGSGSRTGGLSAFGAHSCLVFTACCLVDTLDNKPIYIHMMRPSPAHTRTRTLQERLGIQQDTCYPLTPWSLGEQGNTVARDWSKRRDCQTYRVGRPLDRQSLGLLSAGRMCHV